MFLEATLQNNPALIQAGFELHRKGLIYPNTYVVDLDIIEKNTVILADSAKKHEIRLLAMTKQLGRNPLIAKSIAKSGIDSFVAVDPWEALHLAGNGLKIGNVGHLVQIPRAMVSKVLNFAPEFVTVFNYENAALISEGAAYLGTTQKLILKIDDGLNCYPGQEGGIRLSNLLCEAKKISELKNVEICGLTAFPCVLFDEGAKEFAFTNKAYALKEAEELLKQNGYELKILNMPSANTSSSFEMIAKKGGNLLEPGHAISGTTPAHAVSSQPEIPAIIYVSEIAAKSYDDAYVYGGGAYGRGKPKNALVGISYDKLVTSKFEFTFPPSENIDYHGSIKGDIKSLNIGDTVIAAFRTQIFATRALVAVVSGIQRCRPEIIDIFDSLGKEIDY